MADVGAPVVLEGVTKKFGRTTAVKSLDWTPKRGQVSVIRTLPSIAAPGTNLMVDPDPLGTATDGTRVWIADYGNNLVTELNASNGTFIRTLSDGSHFSTSSYEWGYNFLNAIAVEGTHVWVTSNTGLAELTLEKSP